jgi:hypothetical protein
MRDNDGQIAHAARGWIMQASHVVKLLGGEQVLGRRIGNDLELEHCAREGFPIAVLQALQDAAGLTQDDV